MSLDETTRAQLKRLKQLSDQQDLIEREMSLLRGQIAPKLKAGGLTSARFDYQNKMLKFQRRTDYGAISQKILKQVLQHYPGVNPAQFLDQVLSLRSNKVVETVAIERVKGAPVNTKNDMAHRA